MGISTPREMFAAYDPAYDPLVSDGPGRNRDYAPTWWAASAGTPPDDDGPVTQDTDADVVIIGSGFTGLATALFLAREHGIRATVLEANRVAWGCTSRNGGQGQNASGAQQQGLGEIRHRFPPWWRAIKPTLLRVAGHGPGSPRRQAGGLVVGAGDQAGLAMKDIPPRASFR